MIDQISCCHYTELLSKIDDDSVAAIITDPPFWYKLPK
jgi:DNA modification methylase